MEADKNTIMYQKLSSVTVGDFDLPGNCVECSIGIKALNRTYQLFAWLKRVFPCPFRMQC